MALCAEGVPEHHRVAGIGKSVDAELFDAFFDFRFGLALLRNTGKIAFDVSHEHRYADFRQIFGQTLQGDCFAGTGGAGDQSVPVGKTREQVQVVVGFGDEHWFGHGGFLRGCMEGAMLKFKTF